MQEDRRQTIELMLRYRMKTEQIQSESLMVWDRLG